MRRGRVGRVILVVAGLLLLLGIGAWMGRGAILDRMTCINGRWPGRCSDVVQQVSHGQRTDFRVQLSGPARTVRFRSDSLTLVADLYLPRRVQGSPGIVLLHGSSTFGRKLPLVQVVAGKLADAGYTVLAPDLRGFGDSEDPPDAQDRGAFDFARDVQASLDFLLSETEVDPDRLYVVGHSFGGGVALAGQARDARIRRVVLLGPPRRWSERLLAPGAKDRDYFVARFAEDMELGHPLDFETVRRLVAPLNIENYVAGGEMPLNAALFLVDAEEEDPADLRFLREVRARLPASTAYWTVPGTDHYLNTGLLAGRPIYNGRIMDEFVSRVDQWLRQ